MLVFCNSKLHPLPRTFDSFPWDEIARFIKQQGSFEQAEKRFNGIIVAIRILEDLPHRCPVATDPEEFGQEVRVLLYGMPSREMPRAGTELEGLRKPPDAHRPADIRPQQMTPVSKGEVAWAPFPRTLG
jgi:hypothetical protein